MTRDDREVLRTLIAKGEVDDALSYVENLMREKETEADGGMRRGGVITILSLFCVGSMAVAVLICTLLAWIFTGSALI